MAFAPRAYGAGLYFRAEDSIDLRQMSALVVVGRSRR